MFIIIQKNKVMLQRILSFQYINIVTAKHLKYQHIGITKESMVIKHDYNSFISYVLHPLLLMTLLNKDNCISKLII